MVRGKKIISKIISSSFEVVKDSARQIADTVSPIPDKLVETAVGTATASPAKKDEIVEYLKNLAPDISEEELERRKEELRKKEEKELDETRKTLKKVVTPPHMKPPPKPAVQRPRERIEAEEEQRRAQAEKEKKKKAKPLVTPKSISRKPRLPWFGRKTKGVEGWVKDTKIG